MGFEIKEGVLIKYIEEEGITELSVPESVEIIGEGAFRECENLEYVEFPIGLQRIENKVFYKCKALKDVHLHQ